MSWYYKIGTVVILVLVVIVVIMMKTGRTREQTKKELVENAEGPADALVWRAVPKESAAHESLSTEPRAGDSLSTKQIEPVEESPSLTKNVLAIVNGEEVTLAALNREFDALPSQYRDYFKDDKAGFLEELILKKLLLQDARHKKVPEQPEYKTAVAQDPTQKEQIMISFLLRQLVTDIIITESELREFFNQYKDQLPVKDYDAVKEQLRSMAMEEKQRLVIEDHVNKLQSNAKIVRNEEWIKAQEALVADNPLSSALRSGKPVVADFGRGTCIPCKMMQPILEKLQKEYADKAEILILDVGEYASLSRKYRIQLIPTQIFFDAHGNEIYRHQGFMSEADIVTQLKKMGTE